MIPQHIGVIMDGNRRFAQRLMQKPWMGHKWGIDKARDVLQWACDAGIKYVTTYTLSLENISSRPKKEIQMIFKYLDEEASSILHDTKHVVHQYRVQVRFIGRLQVLPKQLQQQLRRVEQATQAYDQHVLNIGIAYGGQQELVDAMKNILKKGLKGVIKPADLNEKLIRKHLYTNGQPEPDLIFRTGGEHRLSNFLPYQSVYSELIFTDVKWPELTKQDFEHALQEFDRRQRRFGE